jgi:hypothetical protein
MNTDNVNTDNRKLQQKPNTYFIIALVVIGLVFLYYNVFHKEKESSLLDSSYSNTTSQPKNQIYSVLEYSIAKTAVNNNKLLNVTVRITEKVTDNHLSLIAKEIKGKLNPKVHRARIDFILPYMKVDNGGWAIAEFDPDLKIRYLSQSLKDELAIKQNLAKNKNADYLGLWLNDDPGTDGDVLFAIRRDKTLGFVQEFVASAELKHSDDPTPLKKIIRNGKALYKVIDNSSGDYYIIEDNGNLSAYDDQGYIATYKKFK